MELAGGIAAAVSIFLFFTQFNEYQTRVAALQEQVKDLEQDLEARDAANEMRLAKQGQELESTRIKLNDSLAENDEYLGFVSRLVREGRISQIEAEQFGVDAPKKVLAITRPASVDGKPARVGPVITVGGVIHENVGDRTIWIVTSTPGVTGYFPQGSWPDRAGPAVIANDYQWNSPTVYLGDVKKDRGRSFDVIAILADGYADKELRAYLRRGSKTGDFPPLPALPEGAEEEARVEVVRAP